MESLESRTLRVVVVHATMCVDSPNSALQEVGCRQQPAHVARRRDVSGVVVWLPGPQLQSAHISIARLRYVSGVVEWTEPQLQSVHVARQRVFSSVVNVRVALPHSQRTSRVAPGTRCRCTSQTDCVSSQVVPATCALTYLLLPRRELGLSSNQLTSLAGVTFPSSIT